MKKRRETMKWRTKMRWESNKGGEGRRRERPEEERRWRERGRRGSRREGTGGMRIQSRGRRSSLSNCCHNTRTEDINFLVQKWAMLLFPEGKY
jgi:hypothetical protein